MNKTELTYAEWPPYEARRQSQMNDQEARWVPYEFLSDEAKWWRKWNDICDWVGLVVTPTAIILLTYAAPSG